MIKISPSLKLRSAGKKRSSAGRHAYVRHFVPGYPVGLGVDTRTKVAEKMKVRGAGVRLRLVRDDGREGSWWVDEENVRWEGEPSDSWVHKSASYTDPSAAHEKAMKLQSAGAKTVVVRPAHGKFTLTWMERE